MSYTNARQTRIFVPVMPPFEEDDWYEQVLGEVVLPLFQKHKGDLQWLWFTRYVSRLGGDDGDCDINKLPTQQYLMNGIHRSIRLRLSARNGTQDTIEADSLELVNQANCFISDWRDYEVVKDLGGDRFAGAGASVENRTDRAKLVVDFLYSLSQLVMVCLTRPSISGKWHFEVNLDAQNPYHSSFESIHHLFCNMTAVPLRVLLFQSGNKFTAGTYWQRPESSSWQVIAELPIGF